MLETETPCVQLSELITPQRNKEATYLALLFLAQDSEIVLEQDDFYGDVRVKRGEHFGEVRAGVHEEGDEGDEGDEGEAAADATGEVGEAAAEAEESADPAENLENDATSEPLPDEEEEGHPPVTAAAVEQEEQQ